MDKPGQDGEREGWGIPTGQQRSRVLRKVPETGMSPLEGSPAERRAPDHPDADETLTQHAGTNYPGARTGQR